MEAGLEGGKVPVLAVDPGREKAGLAVVSPGGHVLARRVVPAGRVLAEAAELAARYRVGVVVLGDRTGSAALRQGLAQAAGLGAEAVVLVDEHLSSVEGRRRYLEANPARGWRRLLPRSLRVPPGPFDDYAALVLAERFLEGRGARR